MERDATDLPPDMRDATAGEAEAYRRGLRDAVRGAAPAARCMPHQTSCLWPDVCRTAGCERARRERDVAEQLRRAATGLDYRGG